MKRAFLLLILAVGLFGFHKVENNSHNEKLSEAQLKLVKENYAWSSEEFIIVNFRQPINSCHYDNYSNLKNSLKWWTDFYSKIKLNNVRNVFVYAEEKRAKKIIDSKSHYSDINSFFLNNFFVNDKTCYGILVIDNDGNYIKKAGEYNQEDVIELIKKIQ
ncbi:hypothetical protein [Psychroserpens jangbogonensis]|uniref:hypothetical protein n=1 Tax=Psychroserpens jangbogonensis TaxID=1484460 RepID=UPI00053E7D98|nr:hypothetical protein [Psychroserpens jangbogonensis]